MRVLFERDVPCPLRDGTILMANVYRPEGDGAWPVLLTRTPYGKDLLSFIRVDGTRLAEAGYMVVIQDVRGCFRSEGEFVPFEQEFEDGYDAVEWAAQLPGSDGTVGMFGMSYFGFTQWAAAASGHPALKAVYPICAVHDPWDGTSHRAGALEWGVLAGWNLNLSLPALARQASVLPNFSERFGRLVYDIDHLSAETYFELPVYQFSSLRRTELFPYVFEDMIQGNNLEQRHRKSIVPHYARMQVSAALEGGWYDLLLNSTLASYRHLKAAGREVLLTIGPWSHLEMGSMVGDLDFGMAANSGLLNLREDPTTRHQRWFDAQLKGKRTELGKTPPVQYFVMGENRWHFAQEWPLPQTLYTPWYLHSSGHAQGASGDGLLSLATPGLEPVDEYVYDPAAPVLTLGGNLLMTGAYPAGPKEQGSTERREDVLVFTSEALTEPVEVTGPIRAKLWVASSAPDTDFVVRLTDVHPDGRSYNVADGILRMSARNGQEHLERMEPGVVYPIEIDCWATSNLFQTGHRIRVQVTSSNFPRWNRNLNTGASNETTAEFQPARQKVLHDEEHPSHIVLPMIPRQEGVVSI